MLIERRTLLKSLSATVVAPYLVPLVSWLHAETVGQKPMRFVFFLEGNGLPAEHLQPVGILRREIPNMRNSQVKQSGEETLVDLQLSAEGRVLPEPLAPLARHGKL